MTVRGKTLTLKSTVRRQLIDITAEVIRFVSDNDVTEGILTVSVPHATAAVIVNENERGLLSDIQAKIEELFPQTSTYSHNEIDQNADAHLAATFLGHSRTFPIERKQLVRGTWQNIFLVELDGPRARRDVNLTILG
ncbi:MAG TPA: secondary thiamine-phosphate synthase enzyme YjbQ [Candidatus Bathyarchaeia archaeon]|nr:secondary thiamine-phosphate synthase enzyme YjbQ [Candidatus Bathyarchaeia archaeon]